MTTIRRRRPCRRPPDISPWRLHTQRSLRGPLSLEAARIAAAGVRLAIGHGKFADDVPDADDLKNILGRLDGGSYDAKYLAGNSMGALIAVDAVLPSL